MNVGELRALLVGVPDEVEVVVSGLEYDYDRTDTTETRVLKAETNADETRYWINPENRKLLKTSNKIVDVFLIDELR